MLVATSQKWPVMPSVATAKVAFKFLNSIISCGHPNYDINVVKMSGNLKYTHV